MAMEAVEYRFYWMLYLCIINSLDLSILVSEILNENDIDCCYLLWCSPASVFIFHNIPLISALGRRRRRRRRSHEQGTIYIAATSYHKTI